MTASMILTIRLVVALQLVVAVSNIENAVQPFDKLGA